MQILYKSLLLIKKTADDNTISRFLNGIVYLFYYNHFS